LPNPAGENTVLSFIKPTSHARIQLLSPTGTILFSESDYTGSSYLLNLSQYNSGIYLLKIHQEGKKVLIKKVVKQ